MRIMAGKPRRKKPRERERERKRRFNWIWKTIHETSWIDIWLWPSHRPHASLRTSTTFSALLVHKHWNESFKVLVWARLRALKYWSLRLCVSQPSHSKLASKMTFFLDGISCRQRASSALHGVFLREELAAAAAAKSGRHLCKNVKKMGRIPRQVALVETSWHAILELTKKSEIWSR